MSKVLFLQNAWSPSYAGRTWQRSSWLKALERSHSGLRLKTLIDDFGLCHNTTPIVGATPDSIIPPDFDHIQKILKQTKPSVVIACGKQAERSLLKVWDGALLSVPHPSHRFLTNALYQTAKLLLSNNYNKRLALRQGKGEILEESL